MADTSEIQERTAKKKKHYGKTAGKKLIGQKKPNST